MKERQLISYDTIVKRRWYSAVPKGPNGSRRFVCDPLYCFGSCRKYFHIHAEDVREILTESNGGSVMVPVQIDICDAKFIVPGVPCACADDVEDIESVQTVACQLFFDQNILTLVFLHGFLNVGEIPVDVLDGVVPDDNGVEIICMESDVDVIFH